MKLTLVPAIQYWLGASQVLQKRSAAAHQFTIAEEMDAVALQGSPVLGPGESRNGVALHRGRDPQLLALVNGHVAHGTGEAGSRPIDALLGPGLDGHSGIGPIVNRASNLRPATYQPQRGSLCFRTASSRYALEKPRAI